MFNISKFLVKFSKEIDSNDLIKSQIIKILKDSINIDVKIENIQIKNYYISINEGTAVKNKIFIYKESILKEINLLSRKNFKDIG